MKLESIRAGRTRYLVVVSRPGPKYPINQTTDNKSITTSTTLTTNQSNIAIQQQQNAQINKQQQTINRNEYNKKSNRDGNSVTNTIIINEQPATITSESSTDLQQSPSQQINIEPKCTCSMITTATTTSSSSNNSNLNNFSITTTTITNNMYNDNCSNVNINNRNSNNLLINNESDNKCEIHSSSKNDCDKNLSSANNLSTTTNHQQNLNLNLINYHKFNDYCKYASSSINSSSDTILSSSFIKNSVNSYNSSDVLRGDIVSGINSDLNDDDDDENGSNSGNEHEESCLLGIDCNEKTSVGLVLRILADTHIRLDGDG